MISPPSIEPAPLLHRHVPRVTLRRSGLTVPRIGVGLAHLHLLNSDRQDRLIGTALDLGLTHFDTAAFYGDGLSERVLGRLLGARRHEATITTKFGLLPSRLIGRMGAVSPVGRKIRSGLVRLGLARYPRGIYTCAVLQQSLARSLHSLRTDYIDILAIHDPPGSNGLTDELIDALVSMKSSGQVRLIGVAGANIAAVVARWGGVLDIVQTSEERWDQTGLIPDFTYSLFTAGRSRSDPPLPPSEADERLIRALARRPNGAVIVQTSDPRRLCHYTEVATL